jgi:hypothetical protein
MASREFWLKRTILPACHVEIPQISRFCAANPVNCQRTPTQTAPTCHAVALATADHFHPAHPLFIISFNLHACQFTNPGWTNAVQPKLFLPTPHPKVLSKRLRELFEESCLGSLREDGTAAGTAEQPAQRAALVKY